MHQLGHRPGADLADTHRLVGEVEQDRLEPGVDLGVTAERFAQGRTFAEWVAYIGSPENLNRPGVGFNGSVRRNYQDWVQAFYDSFHPTDFQTAALKDLAGRTNAPAKLLVIAECWSSDCRREVPTLARIAEAGGMELRIFNRDSAQSVEPGPTDASDEAGKVRHVHHQQRADLVGDLAELLVLDDTRIG